MKYAPLEQVEAGASVSLTFDRFEPMHLAFYRTIAPRCFERSNDGRFVTSEVRGEARQQYPASLLQQSGPGGGIALAYDPQ